MDINRRDLSLLWVLRVLIEEESVTRAAARLGESQPSLSAKLARLRDIFDDPLLVPSGRRMRATARAQAIIAPLRNHLDGLEALLRAQPAFDPARANRTFRVGSTDYLHHILSAPVISGLGDAAPGLRFALQAFVRETAWADLDSGALDLLLVSARLAPTQCRKRVICRDDFVLVRRARQGEDTFACDLDTFCSLEHVLVSPEGGSFEGVVDERLAALGRTRNVTLSLSSFLLVPSVLQGAGRVAIVPRRLAESFGNGFSVHSPPVALDTFEIVLCWHARAHSDPALTWLLDRYANAGDVVIE